MDDDASVWAAVVQRAPRRTADVEENFAKRNSTCEERAHEKTRKICKEHTRDCASCIEQLMKI